MGGWVESTRSNPTNDPSLSKDGVRLYDSIPFSIFFLPHNIFFRKLSQKPMNFFKPKELRQPAAPPPSPQLLLHRAITSLQTQFSTLLNNLQNRPLKNPFFARISDENNTLQRKFSPTNSSTNLTATNSAMSPEAIEERLAGVPVYALSNGSEEFVLISGTQSRRDLGLFFLTEADAEALLKHMKSVDSSMSSGSQVVPVALSKVQIAGYLSLLQ